MRRRSGSWHQLIVELGNRGVNVLLSNSAVPFTVALYKGLSRGADSPNGRSTAAAIGAARCRAPCRHRPARGMRRRGSGPRNDDPSRNRRPSPAGVRGWLVPIRKRSRSHAIQRPPAFGPRTERTRQAGPALRSRWRSGLGSPDGTLAVGEPRRRASWLWMRSSWLYGDALRARCRAGLDLASRAPPPDRR